MHTYTYMLCMYMYVCTHHNIFLLCIITFTFQTTEVTDYCGLVMANTWTKRRRMAQLVSNVHMDY